MTSGSRRLPDLDVGKGMAIFLVVLGHIVARQIKPAGNDWYLSAQIGLYSFHMAFFFYLAGQVFWTAAPEQRWRRVRQAFGRMLPAYLLMALLGFVTKLVAAPFMPVDRPIGSLLGDWVVLLLYPTEGFVSFLWFIVVLLTLYVLTLVAMRFLGGRIGAVVLLAAVMHGLSLFGYVTKIAALHYAMMNWLFFALGCWTLQFRTVLAVQLQRMWPILMVGLALTLAYSPEILRWTLTPLVALPALHGLAFFVAEQMPVLAKALRWLGEHSWPIYLFNTFAIGAAKVVVLKTIGWDDASFIVALPLLLTIGLMLPIALQRLVLSRVPRLDRITR